MKNSDLQKALAELPADLDVVVWLPGSRVDLTNVLVGTYGKAFGGTGGAADGSIKEILIEGNVRTGSALGRTG